MSITKHVSFSLALVLIPLSVGAEDSKPLKVGIVAPLTGPVASMGVALKSGFDLFKRENPTCTEHSTLIFEDGRYDGKATTTAYQKLTSQDRVDLTVVWGNTPSAVCAPLAERKEAPLLSIAYTPEARGREHVVTFGPKTRNLAKKVADEFLNWGAKKPAAVTVNIGNALEEIGYIKDFVGSLDIQVVALEEVDFRSVITQLKARGSDGLLAFLLPDQALTFAKQAVELDFTPPIMGGDVFADRAFGEKIGKVLPRLAYVYSAVDKKFIEKLQSEEGQGSYFFEVATGYTLGEMICDLARERGKSKKRLLELLPILPFTNTPIKGVRFLQDSEYGNHFENDAEIYYIR